MIVLYTDGSCNNQRGDGGWAWACIRRSVAAGVDPSFHNHHQDDELLCEGHGGVPEGATSNAMELAAIYHALTWALVNVPKETEHPIQSLPLWTDSSYAKKCLTEYLPIWRSRGWTNSLGQPVANRTRIEYIALRMRQLQDRNLGVRLRQVKGHRYYWNEYVDQLAGRARRNAR